jgi:hypothetical protein
MTEKKIPRSYINVEKQLILGKRVKRYDIVAYTASGDIHLIVECKSPDINITQETFDQIARYNMGLKANYLMVTNGLDHFFCQLDYENEKYRFLQEIPDFVT